MTSTFHDDIESQKVKKFISEIATAADKIVGELGHTDIVFSDHFTIDVKAIWVEGDIIFSVEHYFRIDIVMDARRSKALMSDFLKSLREKFNAGVTQNG